MKYSLVAAVLVAAVNAELVPLWGQCGGIGYSGSTVCVFGATCKDYNDYYHQCIPATGQNTTPVDPSPTLCQTGCYTHTRYATSYNSSCPPLTCPPGGTPCPLTTTTLPGSHPLCTATPTITATTTPPCETACPTCLSISPVITTTGPTPTLCSPPTCPTCATKTETHSSYLTSCIPRTCSPAPCPYTSTVTYPGRNPGCTSTPTVAVTETISGTVYCDKLCTECWLRKEYTTAPDLSCTTARVTTTAVATTTGGSQPA